MAMRTPSPPPPCAIPFPIPRLPPVISAVLSRSGNDVSPEAPSNQQNSIVKNDPVLYGSDRKSSKMRSCNCRCALPHPRHDHRDVVGLFRRTGPLFRCSDQVLGDPVWHPGALPHNLFFQALRTVFFSVHILGFGQPVAEGYQQTARLHSYRLLGVRKLLEEPDNRATLSQFFHCVPFHQEGSQMSGIGIGQSARLGVIHRVEERRVPIIGSISEKVTIQSRDEFRGPTSSIERRLAP